MLDQISQHLMNQIGAPPTTTQILLSLLCALGLSLYMAVCYRLCNTKSSFSPRFAVTLIALSLLSSMLMSLIQSNLALSLGMLGSLSIVRFRTNITDPRDLAFICWSMAIGLAAATQSYAIGLAGSLILGLLLVLLRQRGKGFANMLLVVRGSEAQAGEIDAIVADDCRHASVRAKNMLSDSFELIYEVNIDTQTSDNMIERLFSLGGIDSVNLLAAQKSA